MKTLDNKWDKISYDFLSKMKGGIGEYPKTPELNLRHKMQNPFCLDERPSLKERYNKYMERLLEKHPILYKSLMILDIPQTL